MQLKRGASRSIMGRYKKKLKSGQGAASVAEQLQDILRKNFLKIFDVFKQWDEDGSGTIDRHEFAKVLNGLRLSVSVEEAHGLFDLLDSDKSGSLDYKELHHALRLLVGQRGPTSDDRPRVARLANRAVLVDVDERGEGEAVDMRPQGAQVRRQQHGQHVQPPVH